MQDRPIDPTPLQAPQATRLPVGHATAISAFLDHAGQGLPAQLSDLDPFGDKDPARRGRFIKRTRSTCPVCHTLIDADISELDGRVVMRKVCPAHGECNITLAQHPEYYYDSRGCDPSSGCCGPSPSAGATAHTPSNIFETLSTCIALIEIVDSCNLSCPTCFASSPWGAGQEVKCTPMERVIERVSAVLDRKGFVDILQLSGGEPTIHPQFEEILAWAVAHPKIGYVLVNTNAVRLAGDAPFRERLARLRSTQRSFELYVQFDGTQEQDQVALRGSDLRALRTRAIDLCGEVGIPSTLAMTVTPATLAYVGDALRFGVERPHCRGVTFQPMFHSGRSHVQSSTLPLMPPANISVGDLIVALCAQAPQLVQPQDFTPLPCGDPNCHTIGYILRTPEGTTGLSRLVDLASMQSFLRNRVDYRLEDLSSCGCESEPLGDVIKSMELRPQSPFRIFIKPFMDAWTFDQDRIDRCCTHVVREDGTLDSFCHYYLTGGAAGYVP